MKEIYAKPEVVEISFAAAESIATNDPEFGFSAIENKLPVEENSIFG